MTSFTFSIEQLRSAPPEVRRWIEREIAASLAAMSKSEHDASQVHAASLAACMPEEAMQLFELIKGNFLLAQVFFELARETPSSTASASALPDQHRRYPASQATCRRRPARRLLYRYQSGVSVGSQRSRSDVIRI